MVPVRDVEMTNKLYPSYHGKSLDLKNSLQKYLPDQKLWIFYVSYGKIAAGI